MPRSLQAARYVRTRFRIAVSCSASVMDHYLLASSRELSSVEPHHMSKPASVLARSIPEAAWKRILISNAKAFTWKAGREVISRQGIDDMRNPRKPFQVSSHRWNRSPYGVVFRWGPWLFALPLTRINDYRIHIVGDRATARQLSSSAHMSMLISCWRPAARYRDNVPPQSCVEVLGDITV
ncbi:hypothetical protein N657DRAFT_35871 [Parathielavia appendiculata]|uniref:Uncharacterized protein n=1 Tax=Parathielavia appendiculata TaxID=2587402 RepID=A0AAN6Z8B1_9PEZI|nr:hypothetical protein N657DRAFT_35871 [Parathielavia appendiculata]